MLFLSADADLMIIYYIVCKSVIYQSPVGTVSLTSILLPPSSSNIHQIG